MQQPLLDIDRYILGTNAVFTYIELNPKPIVNSLASKHDQLIWPLFMES